MIRSLLALALVCGPAAAQVQPDAQKLRVPGRNAYVYMCVFNAFAGQYDQLAGEMRDLGVVRVRLSTSAKTLPIDPAYVQQVKAFNRAMHARGIAVAGLYLQDALFLHDPAKVAERTDQMLDYNEGLFGGIAAGERFDALDVDVEPPQDPAWSGATWAEKDVLVQDLLTNVVAVIRTTIDLRLGAAADELPFSVGAQHYFHDRVLSGDLTVGKTEDFLLAGANVVSLFTYDDDLNDVVSRASAEVIDTTTPNSIEIVLKTVNDGLDDQTFFEEGCAPMAVTSLQAMLQLAQLSPAPNLVPEVGIFEYDSFREICLPGPAVCP